MRLGLCSRTNDVVEPLIKPQWYVSCISLGRQALDAVMDEENRRMEIIPKQYCADWRRSDIVLLCLVNFRWSHYKGINKYNPKKYEKRSKLLSERYCSLCP